MTDTGGAVKGIQTQFALDVVDKILVFALIDEGAVFGAFRSSHLSEISVSHERFVMGYLNPISTWEVYRILNLAIFTPNADFEPELCKRLMQEEAWCRGRDSNPHDLSINGV
jgi:hypothetical protein